MLVESLSNAQRTSAYLRRDHQAVNAGTLAGSPRLSLELGPILVGRGLVPRLAHAAGDEPPPYMDRLRHRFN